MKTLFAFCIVLFLACSIFGQTIKQNSVTTNAPVAMTNVVKSIATAANSLFVSKGGSDSTGARNSFGLKFLTITAAKASALAGDTIFVYPGTYYENNLLKAGVNYYGYPGAYVAWTNTDVNAGWGIFDDRPVGATTNLIGGTFQLFYYCTNNNSDRGCFVVTNTLSFIRAELDSIDENTFYVTGDGTRAALNIRDGRVDVKIRQITNSYPTENLNFDVESPSPSESAGILWYLGELHVNVKNLYAKNYTVWCHEPAGVHSAEFYLTVDRLNGGGIYVDCTSPNYKTWITGLEILPDGAQGVGYYSGGKHYLTAQKLQCSTGSGIIALGGASVWVTLQKLTCNQPNGMWVELPSNAAGSLLDLTVQQYEDVSGNMSRGFSVTSGSLYVHGGRALMTNGVGIYHAGGLAELNGLTLDTTASNKPPVFVKGAGLLLKGVTLAGPLGTNSIGATNAQTVGIYGVAGRNTNSANVALSPNTGFTVDQNVK